jgi:hypothetical protein
MPAQWRSHWTQVLQNYLDWMDTRARQSSYSVEAQLLNVAAQQLEQSALRLDREQRDVYLTDCPANLDNSGVYIKQTLPLTFDYSLPTHTVLNGSNQPLVLYDDTLPVPTRITVDTTVEPVYLPTSRLFSFTGIGDTFTRTWSTQRIALPTIPFQGRLHFWLEGENLSQINITVRMVGFRTDSAAWQSEKVQTSETLQISSLGWFQSKFPWSSVETLEIHGLPVGSTVTGYCGAFELPSDPDPLRPFSSYDARGALFARYWTITNGFLLEQFMRSNYAGVEYVQSYATGSISAVAVEPNTNGLFVAQGTQLLYIDRREPLPGNLGVAGLTIEPYYGVQVLLDASKLTNLRYVLLRPEAYSAASVTQYRYKLTLPSGVQYALTPNGVLAIMTQDAGWRYGPPIPLTIPLAAPGLYVISLECDGANGVIEDRVIYNNLALAPLVAIDISSLVSQIRGLSFDDRNRLWVWTGTYAVPLRLHYDAYVVDQTTTAIYLTDPVTGLTIDAIPL